MASHPRKGCIIMDRVVRLAVRSKVKIRFDGTKHSASGIPSNLSSMEQRHWPERKRLSIPFIRIIICICMYFLALTFDDSLSISYYSRGLPFSSVFIIHRLITKSYRDANQFSFRKCLCIYQYLFPITEKYWLLHFSSFCYLFAVTDYNKKKR